MLKSLPDDLYDILFDPIKGLSRVTEDRNLWHGLIIYLVVNITLVLATLNLSTSSYAVLSTPELTRFVSTEALERLQYTIPLLSVFARLFFWPLVFFLMITILNSVAELFGGEGKISSLGAVYGYSEFPYFLVALGGLLSQFISFNFTGLFGLVAFFWSMALKITGIQLVYGFSWGRSALVFLMPFIALVVVLFIFFMLLIVVAAPILATFV